MPSDVETVLSVELFEDAASDAGIFTWDIEKNLVFADSALAELFGLDANDTLCGMPLEDYLQRVHPEDRPALAKIISTTIIAEVPQQGTYRVEGSDGRFRSVAAFGRAFRNRDGSPVLYSGIVVPSGSSGGSGTISH